MLCEKGTDQRTLVDNGKTLIQQAVGLAIVLNGGAEINRDPFCKISLYRLLP